MTINFVSSMTAEEEERFAIQLLQAADFFLSDAEFSYVVNVETATGHRLSRSKISPPPDRLVVSAASTLHH